MIRNFRHVGVVVADLDAALDFYGRVLGLEIVRRSEEGGAYLETLLGIAGAKVTTVKMALADVDSGGQASPIIELLYFHHPISRRVQRRLDGRGPTHLAFTVEDIDDLFRHLESEDFAFVSPPVLSADGSVKLAFGRTPDGVYLELDEEIEP